MKLFLPFPYLANSLALSIALLYNTSAKSQIIPDNTTSTEINTSNNVTEITGGTKANSNLFHSFREFSVANGSAAFFNNASEIVNIFSRVTGGNISNINGLIRANNVNLFLINPAGIIFGGGARLDIGGSFYGSSADSILFEDGEFSATDLDNPPLLTINAPIGLSLRDNPGTIENNSVANDVGLQVSPGETLALIGGDVFLKAGLITAPGGLVELGGLSAAGEIGISDGSLVFPEGIARSNVELTEDAAVDVRAGGGGSISVNAKDLLLADTSELIAGIAENMGSPDALAGDITVNATDSITLVGKGIEFDQESNDTTIQNLVGLPENRRIDPEADSSAVGNGGSIFINTNQLFLSNRSGIAAKSYSLGNAGDVNVTANNIDINAASIVSQVREGGEGISGDVNLDVNSLAVRDFSFVITDNKGGGNAGDININAAESVFVGGEIFNALISELGEGVEGEAGNININTKFLTIDGTQGGAQLLTTTKGIGNAGNVNINASETISLLGAGGILSQVDPGAEGNGGNINITTKSLNIQGNFTPQLDKKFLIQASSKGVGDGGNITVNAFESILVYNGSILSQVLEQGTGNAGIISLDAPLISLDDYSLVDNGIIGRGLGGGIEVISTTLSINNFSILSSNARNDALGTGGNIEINSNTVNITNGGVISAYTENDSNGGNVAINADNLEILSGGKIVTQTDGGGNAGNTILNIAEGITINGNNPARSGELEPFKDNLLIELEPETGLFANTSNNSTGNGGNITIVTPNNLNLFNGAQISVDSKGTGNSGILSIQANSLSLDNGFISASTVSGTGGFLSLNVDGILRLDNNSKISAQAFNNANGGNIDIIANFIVATPNKNNDIIANAQQGRGGNINITNKGILGLQERALNPTTNDINVSSDLNFDGTISISNPDSNLSQEVGELPENVVTPDDVVAQTCSPTKIARRVEDIIADRESSFTIKGRGAVTPPPTAPLTSDAIRIEGQNVVENNDDSDAEAIVLIEDSEPVSIDEIVPAQGIIVNEQGEVILTPYPTDNNSPRYAQSSVNCSSW